MLIVSSKRLFEALNSGRRATAQVKSSTPQVYMFTPKENLLIVAFVSDTIVYAEKIKVEGKLRKIVLNPEVLLKILSKRDEDLRVKTDGSSLQLTSRKLEGSVALLDDDDTDFDLKSVIFKKPNADIVDISPLVNAPESIKKVFRSIKDNITDSILSTTAKWSKNTLQVLISDAFHGIVLTAALEGKVNKSELTLPVDAFLVALDIKDGQVYLTDSKCTVMSNTQYLTVVLKESNNSNITFDMVSGLLDAKTKNTMLVDNSVLMDCIASCSSVADKSSSIVIESKKKILKVTMSGPGGKISEKMNLQEFSNDIKPIRLNVENLRDVLHCLGTHIEVRQTGRALLVDWAREDISIQGMCALSEN